MASESMRTLYIDIETSPNLAWVWGLRLQNIGLNQLVEPTRILCAAWSWDGETQIEFTAEWQKAGGREMMLSNLWTLLDHADAVVHYNGASFDVPHMNREFLEAGMSPPSPFAQIDLYRAVRKQFRFPSNKLAYLSQVLDLGDEGKLHTDMTLWTRVLAGEPSAQNEMQRYNEEDVVLLKDLYLQLQPWIPSHPNTGLYAEGNDPMCVACGAVDLVKEGFAYTGAGKFQRYSCGACGKWMRDAKRIETTPMREAR